MLATAYPRCTASVTINGRIEVSNCKEEMVISLTTLVTSHEHHTEFVTIKIIEHTKKLASMYFKMGEMTLSVKV